MLNRYRRYLRFIMLAGWLALGALYCVDSAYAQTTTPPPVPHGTCTTDPQFQPVVPPGGGIISIIVANIKNILLQTSQNLYNNIRTHSGFIAAMQGLLTVYVIFYAIMFTVGMVQITLFDFAIRMIKIGLIGALLSSGSWNLFNSTVVTFFNDGTDDWIAGIMQASGFPTPAGSLPFSSIDSALSTLVSAKTAVTLMAMFFTPPYGPILGLLLVLGLGTFMKAILNAATTYLMALILKSLLFGLAPIFLSFILFNRTRYLFDGWLNQVVNATLQPIMLFTFLGFFVTLITYALYNIFSTPVCWTEWSESVRGSPFSVHYWRFTLCENGSSVCQPYAGKWGANGPQSVSGNYPIFPIDIIGILVLVMLADLCSRFNTIVVSIAGDLAGASTKLSAALEGLGGSSGPKAGSNAKGKGDKINLPNNADAKNSGGKSPNVDKAAKDAAPVGERSTPGGKPPAK